LKAILLLVARLLFVAVYSVAVGLFTGWLAMKLYNYFDKKSRERWTNTGTFGPSTTKAA
jgi:biopolymer transport protein ExbB/TolQ